MSEQRQFPSPPERECLMVRDIVFAPPGRGITGTLEEFQERYRDKTMTTSCVDTRQGGHDVGV